MISLKVKDFTKIPDMLTKRTVFGILAQCWDPLGLVSPTIIKLKIEMQTLWSHGYTWDEPLPTSEKHKWMQLLSSLSAIHQCQTHRCMKPHNAVGLPQLHGFSDGGESGFGSCVFLRWLLSDGSFECRIAAAKAFVAPLKRKTIPRLELMGCVTLTRLMDSVMSALRTPIDRLILWTDSSTALSWIRTPPRSFKPFVGVRVAEIQESYDPMVWRYEPSECNPADAHTKGIPLKSLDKWHQGPEFLSQPENRWPKMIYSDNGTNFVGSQAFLREMIQTWNTSKIQHNCSENGTTFEWQFNCPSASHMNGAVESLIKSIKKAVDGAFGFASYTQSQWITIQYETSNLVNSQPQYPSSDDILDAPPITPNTLLLGHGLIVPQPEKQDVVNPRHLYNAVQHRIQLLWEQWMRHFAPTLVPRDKWFHTCDNLDVGDLCIILDPHHPRALWKLALVEELIPSMDGLV